MNVYIFLLPFLVCITALPFSDHLLDNVNWSQLSNKHISIGSDHGLTYTGLGIIGGENITIEQAPYQVGILDKRGFFCGGSLISTKWVLTAAHCTDGLNQVTVVLGTDDMNANEPSEVRVQSKTIINHEDYDGFVDNDIALVGISREVPLSKYIKVIKLASADDGDYAGASGYATGWGRVSDDSDMFAPVLKGIKLEVLSNSDCSKEFLVSDFNVCTSGKGHVGVCNGDSGGPLVVDGVQIGLVSFGAGKCEEGKPSAYTRISFYRKWITNNIGI